ncbi:thiamine biosynthesis protein ThiS [Saccharospirillum sp. MSK14-1]|nr:thiamine biosynthesis protein ThiS [Saccharospirillum sp. MSK14-1]
MALFVNGEVVQLDSGTTLAALMNERYGERDNMAVALNRMVVPRADWARTELNQADRLDVFHAVAGG